MNKTLMGFIKKEMIQTLRDKRMRILIFLMPIIQMSLFGLAISNDVKNVKIAALFTSDDYIMRNIYENAIESGWFIPAVSTKNDPNAIIESGDADLVLVAPPGGFTKNIGHGDGKLQALINATNVAKAQSVEVYIKEIVRRTVNEDLHISETISPILINRRILFNPDLDTSIFMVPGTMAMLMVITTMLLANIAIVREKEMGTFEMLISAPVTKTQVILGKTVPYVILGMSNFPLILGVAMIAFHVPMRGSFFVLFIAAFAFVCTAVAIGTLVSTYCQNQQQATLAGFLVMFPMIMFSGLMFPIENMPDYIRWASVIDPLSHYMGLLRNIMLKGGGGNYVAFHIAILAVMAMISVYASFRRFHTKL